MLKEVKSSQFSKQERDESSPGHPFHSPFSLGCTLWLQMNPWRKDAFWPIVPWTGSQTQHEVLREGDNLWGLHFGLSWAQSGQRQNPDQYCAASHLLRQPWGTSLFTYPKHSWRQIRANQFPGPQDFLFPLGFYRTADSLLRVKFIFAVEVCVIPHSFIFLLTL